MHRRVSLVVIALSLGTAACDDNLGIGSLARIRVVPTSHAFESVAVGQEEPLQVTVTNVGGGVLTVSSIELTPTTSHDFSLQLGALPQRLGSNQSFAFQVVYRPSNVGADSGRVLIHSDDTSTPTANVDLSTLSIGPKISVTPDVLDFGVVPRGQTQSLSATIKNEGFADLVIENIVTAPGSAFAIVAPNPNPTIAPGNTVPLTVSYTPPGCAADEDVVQIFSNDDTDSPYNVTVRGRPPGPAIGADPAMVSFGAVNLNTTSTQTVTLKNVGSTDLTISSIFLGIGTSPAFTVAAPSTPVTLPSGQSTAVMVSFRPTTAAAASGALVVSSDDCDHGQLQVPLDALGTAGPSPLIQLSPDAVSFGNVAAGASVDRTFNVVSVGTLPLNVTGIALAPGVTTEFSVISAGSFQLAACTTPPCPAQAITVRYSPTSPGADMGDLIVSSNATNTPMAHETLSGNGTAGATCSLDVSPTFLNFQSIAVGDSRDLPINLLNNGTGNCTYQSTDLDPLTGLMGFSVHAQPGVGSVIVPGATKQVVMRLAPPSLGPKFGGCVVNWNDPNPGGTTHSQSVILTGFSVDPTIAVLPGRLDFGLITTGCASLVQTVTIYNTGSGALVINSVHLTQNPTRFQIIQAPSAGTMIQGGASVDVKVRYVPTATGTDTDTLVVESNDRTHPQMSVPLSGQGTTVVDVIDKFVQSATPKVDILFVIDNTGSMGNKQDNLRNNINAIANYATMLMADYQIGVVVFDDSKLRGSPKIIRPTDTNPVAEFDANANVGTNGGSEAGLDAAYHALSDPILSSDNAGFVRPDASLLVVLIGDEDDQSDQSVNFYVSFFYSIKGARNTNLFHFSAIVGDLPNGCTANGGGDAAPRYLEVVSRTGGVSGSICDSSYANSLTAIGTQAFATRSQFFLTRQVDTTQPMSVHTYASEAACDADPNATGGTLVPVDPNTGYTYDSQTNSINFGPQAVPPRGACIKVKYKAACNAP
jgi:hypothetical protein